MPQVNLTPETYEKLKLLAEIRGCSTDALVESALDEHVNEAASAWAERLAEIETKPKEALTEDELTFEIDRVIDEVRAEAAARSLTPEERMKQWSAALAEIRSNIPGDLSDDELTAEIDAALEEVRAERRARSN